MWIFWKGIQLNETCFNTTQSQKVCWFPDVDAFPVYYNIQFANRHEDWYGWSLLSWSPSIISNFHPVFFGAMRCVPNCCSQAMDNRKTLKRFNWCGKFRHHSLMDITGAQEHRTDMKWYCRWIQFVSTLRKRLAWHPPKPKLSMLNNMSREFGVISGVFFVFLSTRPQSFKSS